MGCGVKGLETRVSAVGLRFWVQGFGSWVGGLGFRVWGSGFGAED